MISDSIINTLKPFKTPDPTKANNMIYLAIANAISTYITSVMAKCNYMVIGTTSIGIITTPFAATCLTPMAPTFLLPEYRVSSAMKLGKGELIWPNLFKNIGTHMSIVYQPWKCVPAIIAFPIAKIVTEHFAAVGTEFYQAINKIPPKVLYVDGDSGTRRIWDTFETYLRKAIVTTPPSVVQVSGFVGILPFTGVGTITFSTLIA